MTQTVSIDLVVNTWRSLLVLPCQREVQAEEISLVALDGSLPQPVDAAAEADVSCTASASPLASAELSS